VSGHQGCSDAISYARRRGYALLGATSALALILALAATASPAAAKSVYPSPHKSAAQAHRGPFGEIPKGPVQIIVSIDQQKLHLYSDGAHVADSSVATGVPQLPTPLGIFSVIQKQRFHRSNIYSNAPMPFMQRITWSGVALHEGENIGHPASHGCIRMPHDFAVRLYALARLGARVIVARPELRPVPIADPHLFVHKAAPPPVATAPVAPEPAPPAATVPSPASDKVPAQDYVPRNAPSAPAPRDGAADHINSDAGAIIAGVDGAQPVDPGAPMPARSDPVSPTPPLSSTLVRLSSDTGAAHSVDDATAGATSSVGRAPALAQADSMPPAPAAPAVNPLASPPADAAAPDGAADKAAPPAAAEADVPVPPAKPAALLETAAAAHAPIAIFISGKTQKIYVRQNFTPLFDAPISIDHPDRPLGTHVFTALDYQDDGTTFRWNVVSMPGDQAKFVKRIETERRAERVMRGWRREERLERRRDDLPPPQTPAEVLARIQIPQDVIDRICELMVPGSSLVVSDQGLGEETGEGTDFIVVTH